MRGLVKVLLVVLMLGVLASVAGASANGGIQPFSTRSGR